MNNLVDYGDDSDEDSPRRRSHEGPHQLKSSTSPRQRRDSDMFFESNAESPSRRSNSSSSDRSDTFAEPPPPKRRINDSHSPSPAIRTPLTISMAKVTSVSSLVSYAGGDQDEEDNFDMAELDTHVTDRESLSAAEPPPPPRASQDDQSDGEDERMINEALAESQATLREMNAESSSTGSATPARNDSPQTPAQGDAIEETGYNEIQIPPSPPGEVDPEVQRRFERYFEEKARGNNFNTVLQNRRDFLNPSCYETFIERYELQEKGSNFKPEIFDPFAFPDNCFYDVIAEEQRKIMEKAADAKSKKSTTSTSR